MRFKVQRRRAGATRFRSLRGKLVRSADAGANSLRFRGRIGGRRLKPGSYRLKASVKGVNALTVKFRILKGARS